MSPAKNSARCPDIAANVWQSPMARGMMRPAPSQGATRMRRGGRILVAAVALACGALTASAQERRPAPGSASVVFLLAGDPLSGEIQVREASRPVTAWSTLVPPGTMRQFTVQPGAYRLVLEPSREEVPIAAVVGRSTIVSLAGDTRGGAHYALVRQSQAAPDAEGGEVAQFLASHRVAPNAAEPVSLLHLGSGLIFVVRTD
jgi:hypothetical protein